MEEPSWVGHVTVEHNEKGVRVEGGELGDQLVIKFEGVRAAVFVRAGVRVAEGGLGHVRDIQIRLLFT